MSTGSTQVLQSLSFLVREDAWRRSYRSGEVSQNSGVYALAASLGEASCSFREVPRLAWVDHRDGDPSFARGESSGHRAFVATAGGSVLLEDLREAIIPDSHRKKAEEARTHLKEAAEVKGICYLARREQTYAYEPNYAVPGVRRAG